MTILLLIFVVVAFVVVLVEYLHQKKGKERGENVSIEGLLLLTMNAAHAYHVLVAVVVTVALVLKCIHLIEKTQVNPDHQQNNNQMQYERNAAYGHQHPVSNPQQPPTFYQPQVISATVAYGHYPPINPPPPIGYAQGQNDSRRYDEGEPGIGIITSIKRLF